MPIVPLLVCRSRGLAFVALLALAACAAPGSGPRPSPGPDEGAEGLAMDGAALVLHSGGLDALLVDPRDAGLRRALALLDERLLELPAELGGGAPPPGLVEFLCEALCAPWTLRLWVVEPGEAMVPVRAEWRVHAGSEARAAELEDTFESLLALLAMPSTSAEDDPELTEVETPGGSLYYGTRAADSAFVVAFGAPPRNAAPLGWCGLPDGITPTLALALDLAALQAPLEAFLDSYPDETGPVRKQLEWMGLIGGEPIAMSMAVGHGSDRAHMTGRYQNWGKVARRMGALPSGPIPAEVLELIPSDATLASVSRSEPMMLVHLLEVLAEPGAQEALAQIQGMIGLDLAADVLEPLGETLGFYFSDSTGGGGLASAVLFVGVDDEEHLGRTLDSLATRIDSLGAQQAEGYVRVRAFDHRGTRGLALDFPGLPVPFAPALALHDGHLFVALSSQALAAALDHVQDGRKGLRTHPALKARGVGSLADLQGLFFLDAPRIARAGYGMATFVTAALENAVRSAADPSREPGLVLPPFAELLTGARPTLLLTRQEGEDLVSVGTTDRSALLHLSAMLGSAPTTFVMLGMVAAAIGQRATDEFEDAADDFAAVMPSAEEEKVHADLWSIVAALDGFAEENGRYPDSLEELLLPDADGLTWLEPAEIPLDPWGNPYAYEFGEDGYRITSYGRDGVPGGEGADRDIDNVEYDDLDAWELLEPEEGEWPQELEGEMQEFEEGFQEPADDQEGDDAETDAAEAPERMAKDQPSGRSALPSAPT